MHFRSLRAHNFRLLRRASIELHPRLNYFIGGNGAGKTTVLEALHVLGRAASYRGATQSFATDGESGWSLEASLGAELAREDAGPPPTLVRVQGIERRLSITINHRAASLSELVRLMPVLVIDPLAHRIMEEGPGIRRRYIDWGVFHMEHEFHAAWAAMNRALRQRNAALRAQASSRELAGWNAELVTGAERVTAFRRRYVEALRACVNTYWNGLLGDPSWTLRFHPGWREELDYAAVLRRNEDSDRRLGHTREGPHRAELQILSDNTQLRERISRGQQKLLVASLVLAQSELYRRQHDAAPVLLVDDFAAELSQDSQRKLLVELEAYEGQKFIAALDAGEASRGSTEHCMFHMEHGQITMKKKT